MTAARSTLVEELELIDVRVHEHAHAGPANGVANGPDYDAGRVEYDVASGLIIYEEYHPFGTSAYRAVDSTIEVSPKRYRYAAAERDEETGLDHMGLRYYAPWLGRWTSADPIGLGDGVNRYAYVHGNPVSMRDPGGTRSFSDTLTDLGQKAIEGLAAAGETIEGGYQAVAGGLRDVREAAKEKTREVVSEHAGETAGKAAETFVGIATGPLEVSATLGEAGGEALASPLKAPKRFEAGVEKILEGSASDDQERFREGVVEATLAAGEIAGTVLGARGALGAAKRLGKMFGVGTKAAPGRGGGAGGRGAGDAGGGGQGGGGAAGSGGIGGAGGARRAELLARRTELLAEQQTVGAEFRTARAELTKANRAVEAAEGQLRTQEALFEKLVDAGVRGSMLEQRAGAVRSARRVADRAEAQAALASIRVAEASTRLNVIVTELAQIQQTLRGSSRL